MEYFESSPLNDYKHFKSLYTNFGDNLSQKYKYITNTDYIILVISQLISFISHIHSCNENHDPV